MQDGLKACDQLNQLTVKTFHGLCAHIFVKKHQNRFKPGIRYL
ncbi:hypothetical protein [Acaryochloris sp. CCMEE 5410]